MAQISATSIRQVFLILLIAGIFSVIFWNLAFFVPALLGAYTLYILLRGPLHFLTERWKWRNKLAVAVLMLVSLVLILLPFQWLFSMLSTRIMSLVQNYETHVQNLEAMIKSIESRYNVSLLTQDNIKSLSEVVIRQLQTILGATIGGLGLLLATYFILWFMLTDSKKMEQSFFEWLPLRPQNVTYVRKQLNDMVWGNALGIPLMAIVQGLAGLLIYWILDVPDPWMWFAITCISSMLPVIGVALAFIPLTILFLSQGEQGKAIVMLLYGLFVTGTIDNFARMWLLRKMSDIHPLITLFGVVVGLQLFGFIGFVFGPIVISMFLLLLHIYHKEFHTTESKKTAD